MFVVVSPGSATVFDVARQARRLAELDTLLTAEGLWADRPRAEALTAERARVDAQITPVFSVDHALSEAEAFFDLARAEGDDEAFAVVEGDLDALSPTLRELEIARALADPLSRGGALVSIHPGAGGDDAKDFAAMLLRMYLRWADRCGFDVEVLHEQEGKSAGIDGAAIRVSGEAAYGWLRGETGVHRLVRVSPFGAADRRQTSFVAVEVTPDVDDTITVTILESDLEVKATCAGGPGGQNVNKVATAIRMRHVPTGVVVFARTERSHHQNRANALRLLRAKLAQREIDRREEIAEKERGARPSIRSGHQLRSYVFSPNRQVKDERTGVTRHDIDRVLDGDIDELLEAAMVRA